MTSAQKDELQLGHWKVGVRFMDLSRSPVVFEEKRSRQVLFTVFQLCLSNIFPDHGMSHLEIFSKKR